MKALAEIWKDYKDKPDVVINDVFEDEDTKRDGVSQFGFTKPKNTKKDSSSDSDTEYETDEESEYEDESKDTTTYEMSKEEKEFYKQEAVKVIEMKLRFLRLGGSLAKNKGFGFIVETPMTEKNETLFNEDDGIVDDEKLDNKFKIVKKKFKVKMYRHQNQSSFGGSQPYSIMGCGRGRGRGRGRGIGRQKWCATEKKALPPHLGEDYWKHQGPNPYMGTAPGPGISTEMYHC